MNDWDNTRGLFLQCMTRLFPEGSARYSNIEMMQGVVDEYVETVIKRQNNYHASMLYDLSQIANNEFVTRDEIRTFIKQRRETLGHKPEKEG